MPPWILALGAPKCEPLELDVVGCVPLQPIEVPCDKDGQSEPLGYILVAADGATPHAFQGASRGSGVDSFGGGGFLEVLPAPPDGRAPKVDSWLARAQRRAAFRVPILPTSVDVPQPTSGCGSENTWQFSGADLVPAPSDAEDLIIVLVDGGVSGPVHERWCFDESCTSDQHGDEVRDIATRIFTSLQGQPEPKFVDVDVIDGASGTTAAFDAGLAWVFGRLVDWKSTRVVVSISMDVDTAHTFRSMQDCAKAMPDVAKLVDDLVEAGVTVVSASGNKGSALQLGSPGCIPGVVSVGGYGEKAGVEYARSRPDFLDLVAPATNVMGLGQCWNGTSFAAPSVAAALGRLSLTKSPEGSLATLCATRTPLTRDGDGCYDDPGPPCAKREYRALDVAKAVNGTP